MYVDCFSRFALDGEARIAFQLRELLNRERECLTDNGNRTLHQIREILNEHKCVDFFCCPRSFLRDD